MDFRQMIEECTGRIHYGASSERQTDARRVSVAIQMNYTLSLSEPDSDLGGPNPILIWYTYTHSPSLHLTSMSPNCNSSISKALSNQARNLTHPDLQAQGQPTTLSPNGHIQALGG
ncbi:hypothetical protein CROQUDRAFT_660047 [Cronartium quercuum f. sp. fusiforme G11]|uniref:Uncharacterized protein n=1 Tax=Cronartium quercuum f. sp. fusiforme G11 TaxID=708437 RepID=A0A9P6NHP3_9BASI|nr:hypothetical protein CROQUDRAFT_660047 [Cronartium quercuum f. sp. fusiforme G11]